MPNRGVLSGLVPERVLPPWMGTGDPSYDGQTVVHDSASEGDLRYSPVPASGPRGLIGYVQAVTAQTGIGTTTVDVTGMTWTGTLQAGRRYKATFYAPTILNPSTANTEYYFNLLLDGVQFQAGRVTSAATTINASAVDVAGIFSVSFTGTHTVKVTASTLAGTVGIFGSTVQPIFLLIEDIDGGAVQVYPTTGYSFRGYNSTALGTITGSTWTPVPLQTEMWKTDPAMHSTTVNPSRWYCTQAGKYLASASVQWSPDTGGTVRYTTIIKNGDTTNFQAVAANPPATSNLNQTVTMAFDLVPGDYLDIQVFTDGTTRTIANNMMTSLAVNLVSGAILVTPPPGSVAQTGPLTSVSSKQSVGTLTSWSNTAYANLLNPATIVKRSPTSSLRIRGSVSGYMGTSGSTTTVGFTVNGVDRDGGLYFFNAASDHRSWGLDTTDIQGLPAGTYSIQPRIKVGAFTFNMDNNDQLEFIIEEVETGVYTSGATTPPPWRARMWKNGTLTFTTGTTTTNAAFDTVDYDPFNLCTTGASSRFTCPTTGFYQVSARTSLGTPVAGDRIIAQIFKNGVEVLRGSDLSSPGTNPLGATVNGTLRCQAGDQLAFTLTTVLGANRNAESGSLATWMSVDCLG